MSNLKSSTNLVEQSPTQSVRYFTLRTPHQTHRPVLRDRLDPPPNMFCSGNCTEATCFEALCGSCLQEWHDWNEERS